MVFDIYTLFIDPMYDANTEQLKKLVIHSVFKSKKWNQFLLIITIKGNNQPNF